MSGTFCLKNQLVRRGVHLSLTRYLSRDMGFNTAQFFFSLETESIPFNAMQAETAVNTE